MLLPSNINKNLIQDCELHIIGHKIFVRMKDVPMYLSKKVRDSIRNRYSHSIEVGLATEYIIDSISKDLQINLNFFGVAKIVGLVHDIGHTAFSHDGEVILNKLLQEASRKLGVRIYFDANLNNFRRIFKYGLFDPLLPKIKRYTLASLLKHPNTLYKYPEFAFLQNYLEEAIALEEKFLAQHNITINNKTQKTILCQAMDLADENRYLVTDIIDSLNIYSKEEMKVILQEMIQTKLSLQELAKFTFIHKKLMFAKDVKELLIALLEQESKAKTNFQTAMNTISMAFNRNFYLSKNGALKAKSNLLDALKEDFKKIGAKYIWGSKKIKKIKKPFNESFAFVARYFLFENYDINLIDSHTYKKALIKLKSKTLDYKTKRLQELILLRNFLGGLTNPKIEELYKKIVLSQYERKHQLSPKKRKKLLYHTPIKSFKKKIKYI